VPRCEALTDAVDPGVGVDLDEDEVPMLAPAVAGLGVDAWVQVKDLDIAKAKELGYDP
jgi:hypothetical protein